MSRMRTVRSRLNRLGTTFSVPKSLTYASAAATIFACPPACWKMLLVRMPENAEILTLLYGPTRIVSGFPPFVHALRSTALTAASVTVATTEPSTGAVVPVPVTKPVETADAGEVAKVVQLEVIQDSADAETRAVAVPPTP